MTINNEDQFERVDKNKNMDKIYSQSQTVTNQKKYIMKIQSDSNFFSPNKRGENPIKKPIHASNNYHRTWRHKLHI